MSVKRYGDCQECGQSYTLTKAGVMRHHGGEVGTGPAGWGRAYRCKGSGMPPKQHAPGGPS